MTERLCQYRFTIVGLLLTPIACVAAFISGGFGHGSYVAARIVLPFACLALGSYTGTAVLVLAFGLLQWPLYGLVLDKTAPKRLAAVALTLMHAALCLRLFLVPSDTFF